MAIKILLADDSLTIQKVVELTFSDAETRLMAVGSGDRAVQALDDFQPDIVLADVVMPGLTGYDVCDAVKQRPGGVFIPVVLLTGTFEPFDRARAERVGSDAIVTKPFDSHALQGLVRDLVAKARAVREEAEAAAAAAALAPPAPPATPVPPPVPEPPPTMILSVEELEAEVPTRVPYAEDTGATQAMPALVLPESFPPPFEAEEPVVKVEESNFRTMAMRIPTAEELAAAAPMEVVEPAPAFAPPPPPPAFYEPEAVSLAPPPPSPFYRPEAAFAAPPPPPASDEPEVAAILPPTSPFDMSPAVEVEPPAPAVFEPEFVPPAPPPPPAFYEPEPAFEPPPPSSSRVPRGGTSPFRPPDPAYSSGLRRARGDALRRAGGSVRTRVRAGVRALRRRDGQPRAGHAGSCSPGAVRDRSGARGRIRPGRDRSRALRPGGGAGDSRVHCDASDASDASGREARVRPPGRGAGSAGRGDASGGRSGGGRGRLRRALPRNGRTRPGRGDRSRPLG
ncbi:MAG: response regulator [Holophagales bacterium]|nr:response regulator [Holophagales bacterium]